MNMNMNEVGWDGRDGFHFQHPLTLPFQVKSHKLLIIIKVEWQKKSATNSLLSFSHLAVWFHFCHTVWLVLIWWSVQPSANNNIRIQVKKNIIIVETLSVCIDLRLPLRNSSFMDSFNLSLAHSLTRSHSCVAGCCFSTPFFLGFGFGDLFIQPHHRHRHR